MELSSEGLRAFFETVLPHLDEKQRRIVTGAMVEALGRGGQARVVEASGQSSSTVLKAAKEVRAGVEVSQRQRGRAAVTGRRSTSSRGSSRRLMSWSNPGTRGSPMSALRWTLKSTYELARDLQGPGFRVSAELVRRLLHQLGYSLQAPAKRNEGTSIPIVTASSLTSTVWPANTSALVSR